MEDTLYGISAFRYYRVPPRVLAMLPPLPQRELDTRRARFKSHVLVSEMLGAPVHLLIRHRKEHAQPSCVIKHLQSTELPLGHFGETPFGIVLPSPEMTLLQMAQSLSPVHLAMAMYEMCGTFSVFRPTKLVEEIIAQADAGRLIGENAWERVPSDEGRSSDLWRRPPLTELASLHSFAKAIGGHRGSRTFLEALGYVTGITASPFEAQLSLLLAVSRCKGGEGVTSFANNVRIALSGKASRIANRSCCYADLLFEKAGPNKPLVVECQGKIVHNNRGSALSDSDRATALQQMGFNVLLLTYPQIANEKNFEIVKRLIFKEAGLRYREKSLRQLDAQRDLRRELFIDWNSIGL